MVDRVRILRNGTGASQLQALLTETSVDTPVWMERHTNILKRDAGSLVGMLRLGEENYWLKLYRNKSRFKKALLPFGIGRPLRSYNAALTLRREGLQVPEPLCCLVVPEGVMLLAEGIPGEGNLREVWARNPAEEEARHILQIAGQTIAQLHMSLFAHGDCKWSNMLWDGRTICLVDLDDVSKAAERSLKQARDLARFTLNAEELEIGSTLYDHFLESYMLAMGDSRANLVPRFAPFLYSLRAKHLARYGPRGQRLV